jgi:hypothetical protein
MIDVIKTIARTLIVDIIIRGTIGGVVDGLWAFMKENQEKVTDLFMNMRDGG